MSNYFVWMSKLITLENYYPFTAIFIYPQMKPASAYLFDFYGWQYGHQVVRQMKLPFEVHSHHSLTNRRIQWIADMTAKATKYDTFELEDIWHHRYNFKTFHANFTLSFDKGFFALKTCLNDTSVCRYQNNETVEVMRINQAYLDAAYVTLGYDRSRWSGFYGRYRHVMNATQVLCCEVYENPKNTKDKPQKLCRVKGSYVAVPCNETMQDNSCGVWARGY